MQPNHDMSSTVAFIAEISRCDGRFEAFDPSLHSMLISALRRDGFLPEDERRLVSIEDSGSTEFDWFYILMVVLCSLCAALASGLQQGLLSLDVTEIRVKAEAGTEYEKKCAQKLLPLISRHHLLLVTLLLWNATAAAALPMFFNQFVSRVNAVILSVTVIVFFGKIIPSSVFTGPHQLYLTATLVPVTKFAICVFLPLSWPTSKLLDYFLGNDAGVTLYSRKEMRTLAKLQVSPSL